MRLPHAHVDGANAWGGSSHTCTPRCARHTLVCARLCVPGTWLLPEMKIMQYLATPGHRNVMTCIEVLEDARFYYQVLQQVVRCLCLCSMVGGGTFVLLQPPFRPFFFFYLPPPWLLHEQVMPYFPGEELFSLVAANDPWTQHPANTRNVAKQLHNGQCHQPLPPPPQLQPAPLAWCPHPSRTPSHSCAS